MKGKSLKNNLNELSAEAVTARFAPHTGNPIMQDLKKIVLARGDKKSGKIKSVKSFVKNNPDVFTGVPPPFLVAEKNIQMVVKNVEHLFTLPDHVLRIMNMLRSHNVSVEKIVNEINKDPVLVAETLKVVNSGFYGFQHRVSSIQHAIVIMGLHVIQSIVLSVSVVDFSLLKNLWRHSVICAHACALLVQRVDIENGAEISVDGLLHDIGKAVLAEYLRDEYKSALNLARREKIVFYEAERIQWGVTHAEIAQWLLDRWGLAPATVAAIGFHHNFNAETKWAERIAVVHVADALTNALGFHSGEDTPAPPLHPSAIAILNLDMDILREVVAGIIAFVERDEENVDDT